VTAQRPPPDDAPAAEQALVERLVQLLVQASEGRLQADAIDPDEHLYDCGYLDSMSAAGFLAALAQQFGVRLRESQLIGQLDHVRALARHVLATAPQNWK
jgi:acyl carrier protein